MVTLISTVLACLTNVIISERCSDVSGVGSLPVDFFAVDGAGALVFDFAFVAAFVAAMQ
jgi:hypothetical protein